MTKAEQKIEAIAELQGVLHIDDGICILRTGGWFRMRIKVMVVKDDRIFDISHRAAQATGLKYHYRGDLYSTQTSYRDGISIPHGWSGKDVVNKIAQSLGYVKNGKWGLNYRIIKPIC